MNEQEVKKLYQALLSKGYSTQDLGDEGRFMSKMADAGNRKQLYNWVSARGNFRIGDFAAYEARLTGAGAAAKPQPTQNEQQPAEHLVDGNKMVGGDKPSNIFTQEQVDAMLRDAEKRISPQGDTVEQRGQQFRQAADMAGSRVAEDENTVRAKQERLREQVGNNLPDIEAQLDSTYNAAVERAREATTPKSGVAKFVHDLFTPNRDLISVRSAEHDIARNDPEVQALTTAKQYIDDSRNMIEAADRGDENFFKGAARGFGEKFMDLSTWDFGLTELQNNQTLRAALDKADNGEELTDAERSLLDAAAVKTATDMYFGSYLSRGYKAGSVTAESLPFMIEMASNPLSATGKTAASKMLRYTINRFGRKAATSGLGKAGLTVARGVGDVAGAAGMAGTTGLARVAADAERRMMGDVQFNENPDADRSATFTYGGHTEGDEEAWKKAFLGTTIENYSEMVGAYFAPAIGYAGKGVRKGLDKIGLRKVNELVDNVSSSDLARLVSDFENRTQWNGTIGEYAEEVAGGIMNALLVGDQTLDTDERTGVFNLDNNIDTFLGVALMGGVISAIKTAGYRTPKYRARQDMTAKDDAAAAAFGNQDKWGEIRNVIAFGSDEDVEQKVKDIVNDTDLTPEQRQAALEYVKAAETYKGMLKGEEIRRADADPLQVDAETSFDNGYSLADEQERNDAKNMLDLQRQKAVDTFGEIKGLDTDPIATLQTMREGGFTPEQIQIAIDYVNAKATYDGMMQRVQDDVDSRIAASDAMIDSRRNREDGMIHPAILNNDRKVYVVGGNLVMAEDGSGIDREASRTANVGDGMILVRDAVTDDIVPVSVEDFLSADEAIDADREKQTAQEAIRQQFAQEAERQINGVLPFNVGDTYNVLDEQGQAHTVTVVPVPVGETDGRDRQVQVAENEVLVSVDGGEAVVMTREQIQLMADNANLARLQAHEEQKEQQRAQQAAAEAEAARPQYHLNDVITLRTDNGIVRGSIVAEANVDGQFEVYTEAPVNGKKINLFTRDELDSMLMEHNGNVAPEAQPAGNEAVVGAGEEGQQDSGQMAGGIDSADGESGGAESNQPVAPAIDRIPVLRDDKGQPILNKKGKPQYVWHEAAVGDTADALTEQAGGSMLTARDVAADMVGKAKEQLEKVRKQKPKGEDPIELIESRNAIQQAEQQAQGIVKYWQDVNQEIQRRMREEQARKQAEAEAAKGEQQKAREAEEKRKQEERLNEIERQRLAEAIEKDRERRNKEYEPLAKARKEMGDDAEALAILDDTEPRDLEEWVSSLLTPHSILWQDASDSEVGLRSELGLKRGDIQRFMNLLGTKENGAKPFGKVVLDIYTELPEAMREQYTDQDVRNTLLNLFNEGNSTRMMNLAKEHRIKEAREVYNENLRREQQAEMDAWEDFYHLTAEERETFEDFMQEPPTAVEQEVIDQIIADNGQNQSSETMDQQPVIGADAAGTERGQGQVRGETEGTGEVLPSDGTSEGTAAEGGEQAPAGDAVAGGTQGRVSNIQGLESYSEEDITDMVRQHFAELVGGEGVEIVDMKVIGSRVWGNSDEDSDLDVLLEYSGNMREDTLFDILNDEENRLYIDGIPVDINPITKYKSGTIAQFMERNKDYDKAKDKAPAQQPIGKTSTAEEIAAEEGKVDTNPSEAQKEAGNYQKGHIKIDGFDVTIENPKGSVRSGFNKATNTTWETVMHNTYGYIKGTEGVDGDHIDVFLSDNPTGGNVFVVDQVNNDGTFDEHKVMYGFNSADEARAAYLSNYEEGWQGLGAITEVSKDEFKKWVNSSHRKTKPFADYKSVKPLGGQNESSYHVGEQFDIVDDNEKSTQAKIVNIDEQGNVELVIGWHGDNYRKTVTPKELDDYRERETIRNTRDELSTFIANVVDDGDYSFVEKATPDEVKSLKQLVDEWDFYESSSDNTGKSGEVWSKIEDYINRMRAKYPEAEQKASDNAVEPEFEAKYQISPKPYTTKKGKVLDMQLVKFADELKDKVIWTNARQLAKDLKGWWSREDGGFLMRDAETAQQLADTVLSQIGNNDAMEQQLRDERLSLSDMALATDEAQNVEAVDASVPESSNDDERAIELFNGINEGDVLVNDAGMTATILKKVDGKSKKSQAISLKWEKTVENGQNGHDQTILNPLNFMKWVEANNMHKQGDVAETQQQTEQQTEQPIEQPQQPTEQAQGSTSESGYGANNTLVSRDRYEELKERMRKKMLGQLNMGIDPEILAIGTEMAAFHIEAGARKFADFAKKMIEDLGDAIRPYLKAFYNGARDLPEVEEAGYTEEMSPYDEVKKFDVANFDKTVPDAMATAEEVVKEQQVEQEKTEAEQKLQEQRNDGRKAQEEGIALDGTPLRAMTEEDLDERNLPTYYQGRRVYIMLVSRSGEQISATQFSKPKIDYIMLTNGKTVQLDDLMVADSEKPQSKETIEARKARWQGDAEKKSEEKGKKTSSSKKKSVSLQQEPDLFSNSFGEESTSVESQNERNNDERRENRPSPSGLSKGESAGSRTADDSRLDGSLQEGRNVGQGDSSVSPAATGERKRSERPVGRLQGIAPQQTLERPANPKNTHNNHAERGTDYAPSGVDARIDANIKAIELMKQLMDSGEQATPEQMAVLRQFSGWGGLGKAFENFTVQRNGKPQPQYLRELLGEEAYEQANMSRNSAYYTPAHVIDTLWDIARAMGFKGGKVLEGSAGIGNILGLMPTDMSERSDIQAVEIDQTTGNILSLLYPDAKVDVQGFEATQVENGSVDLAITNVPFVTGLHVKDTTGDKDLSKKFRDIQDFCIAKNVRKLKEGGIGIFITSSGTLDNSARLREWIVQEGGADVVGAFRLNNETFGGTGATSDIIVIRKRVNGKKSPHAIDVLSTTGERTAEYDTGETKKVKGEEIPIIKQLPMDYNSYFVEHPEMMGGEMRFNFEMGETRYPTSRSLFPVKGKNQADMLKAWAQSFSGKDWGAIPAADAAGTVTDNVYEELGEGVKEGSMVVDKKGNLCIAQRGKAVPLDINANKVKGHSKVECFEAYQGIKKALADLLEYQTNNEDDAGLQPRLKALNKTYDDFVKTYGHLHKNISISFLKNDVDFANILALEKFSERGDVKTGKRIQEFGKTDIFSQRVVDKEKAPEPDNVKDGIIASIYVHGRIDVPWIVEQLNKNGGEKHTEQSVKAEIVSTGLGFENPATRQMEVSYEYLSGNVREKLAQARANNADGQYNANIKALEAVVPMDIPSHLIDFNIGSSWIDPKLYEEYVKEKTDVDVTFTPAGGTWFMKTPNYVGEQKNRAMGVVSELLHKTIPGTQLIEAAMQNKTITVSETHKKWDGTTETITDKEATQACANKIDEIRQDFKDWARAKMQSDPAMSERIERTYNDLFNNYVPTTIPAEFVPAHFGGAATTVDGRPFSLRPHQGKAVVRGTIQPLLLAHEVGTGKTYTLISTAMEMRRLGTARKPMIVVQNATVGQFVESAKKLYPNAKVLTLEDKDHTGEGRKNFYAKIKYNDWDMIVVPQSVFERIPDSEERQMKFVKDKIQEKELVLEQMRDADPSGSSMIVKQAEKEIEKLADELLDLSSAIVDKRKERDEKRAAITRQNAEVKALEMLDRQTDDVENFDDMGIDAILVDEAHEYKHLGFATAMQRGVKGVDPSYSKKAQGVYLKTQAVLEKNNGRNVIFATGTPISNTAAEIWTFMRYLMPADTMKEYDIYYFDDFVRNFGNLQQMLEFTTSGKFKENNRFAGYVNLPELVRIWAGVADTVLTREAGGVSDKIPDMESGKAIDIYLPQTRALRSVMKFVKKQLDDYDNMSGKQKKENSHIPLTMYGIAKAAAVDARLVVSDAADEPQSKTNEAVRQTLKSLRETESYNGTVALFADNYQNKKSGFNLYEDIRRKLIEQGVPAEQIVVMKSGMSVKKKLEIFDKVNRGEVRVIMGSTFTLGTGVNIQERLHTLIHLDAPNRPMDYTQRNGRILRQGNLHKEMGKPVRVLRFGVEDSLDVTAYQRLKTKGAIADSIMNGKQMMNNSMENRALEEEDDVFGDTVAQLSGSEYAMLKNQAEKDVRKYEAKKKQYQADQTYCHNEIPRLEGEIKTWNVLLKKYRRSLETIESLPAEKTITVGKQSFPSVEAMADFIKEYNKTIKEAENELRDNPSLQAQTRRLTVNVGGIDFVFNTELSVETKKDQGTLFTAIRRRMTYNCDALGLSDVPVRQSLLREGLEDIMQNVITGQDARDGIELSERVIEKSEKALAQVRERYGKPFEFKKELEQAHERLDEYSELMKKELEEKEKKYAEMDADVEAATDINETEESDEEAEEEDDVRFREVSDTMQREGTETPAANAAGTTAAERTAERQKQAKEYAERQWRRAHDVADEWAQKLGLSDVMQVVDSIEDVPGSDAFSKRKRRAKGWYDAQTGKIVIVLGNHRSPADVLQTILHEAVGHYGLRKLFGQNFDTFLDNVYQSAALPIKEKIAAIAAKQRQKDTPANKARRSNQDYLRIATEEYLSGLAESTDFEDAENKPWVRHWFNQIKAAFLDLLKKVGLRGFAEKGVELSDNELRYILWRSYKNMTEPGRYRNVFDVAENVAMEVKLGLAANTPKNIEDEIPIQVLNHKDEEDIRKRVSQMTAAEALDAYKRINDSMRDEDGLDLDEHFEKTKQDYIAANGIKGVGKQQADELQAAIDKYGGGMVTLRWELQDRLKELGIDFEEETAKHTQMPGRSKAEVKQLNPSNAAEYITTTRGAKFSNEDKDKILEAYNRIKKIDPSYVAMIGTPHGYVMINNDARTLRKSMPQLDNMEPYIVVAKDNLSNVLPMFVRSGYKVATIDINDVTKASEDGADIEWHGGTDLFRDEEEDGEESEDAADVDAAAEGYDAGKMTLEESITKGLLDLAQKNEENLQLRINAMRQIGGNLNKLRSAMARQREYDRQTVDGIVRLAKMVIDSGLFKGFTPYEVKRLMGMVNRAAGREDITKQAGEVVDLMIRHQLKELDELFHSQMKVKGSKLNNSGVEVQAGLDIDGQRMVKAMKDAMSVCASCGGQTQDQNGEPTAWGVMLEDVFDRMGDDDEATAHIASVEYQGYLTAQQWFDTVKSGELEERVMRHDLKQAKEEQKAGRMTREEYKQYRRETEAAIRESRLERIAAYEKLISTLGAGIKESIDRAEEWRERERQRVNEIHHNANSDLLGVPADEHRQLTWQQKAANWSFVRFFMKPLATFNELLRYFGSKSVDGKGYLWNRFIPGVTDASDREWKNLHRAHEILDAKASEVFGKDMSWSDLFDEERKMPTVSVEFWDAGEKKSYDLTQGNLLYIYLVNKMTDGRMKLRKMGITEEDVEAIKDRIDPRFLALGEWLQDVFLKDRRKEYNAVYERMFGAPMPTVHNYFPLRINSRSRGQEEDIGAPTYSETKPATITGSVIKRTRNSLPLDITGADAFDVVLGHLQDMEHWAAYAELNRDMNTLFSYKRFRNRVMNMSSTRFGAGNTLWKNFKDAAAIAAGSYRPPVNRNSLDTYMVNIAKGVTQAKIAFRLYTAMKQLLSYPAYFSEANVIELAKSTNPLGGAVKAWNWAIEELPGFAKRWQSRQAGDNRLDATDVDWQFWRNKIVRIASRMGMKANAFVDALTVAMGAKAIYETRLKQYKTDGYSDEQAKQKALHDASIAYNETQQSSEGAYISEMQVSRSAASVALSVFRNAPFAYQRRLFRAIANLKHKMTPGYQKESIEFMRKKMVREGVPEGQAQQVAERVYNRSWYKDVANVAIFGFLLQAAWNLGPYLAYLFLGDDDDEKDKMYEDALKHAVAGSVEGLTGGNVMSDLYNMVRNGDNISSYNFNLLPLMSDVQTMMRHYNSDMVQAANDFVNIMVQSGVGVNPQTLTDLFVALTDYTNGDPQTSKEFALLMLRVASAPQSAIDKLYIDELGMTAADARKADVTELAHRYAKYKRRRNAPLTGWAYSDEARDAAEGRYVRRFEDMLKERADNMSDESLQKAFEENSDETVKKALGNRAAKRLDAKDTYGSPTTEYGKVYLRMRNYFDMAEDILLQTEEKKAKEAGDEERYDDIKKARKDLTDIKRDLADARSDEERNSIMQELRRERTQYLQEFGISKGNR